MRFRTRLFLAFAVAVLAPLALLAWGVRREVESRLAGEYRERVERTAAVLAAELAAMDSVTDRRLAALAGELAADNRFRAALRGDPAARRWLLDWGGEAAPMSGLAFLELQDSGGRILSSGHFRNEYDGRHPELAGFLAAARSAPALVRARTPEGALTALGQLESFEVSGRRFVLAGGLPFGADALERLVPDPSLRIALALPASPPSLGPDQAVVREIALPYLDAAAAEVRPDTARLLLIQSAATLAGLRRGLNLWFAVAFAAAAGLGLGLAAWLAGRVSRPLRELAARTEAIDLDRLDQEFPAERDDEIGALSRVLGAMTGRLRTGAARLREAERRVAMSDVARQVNHDVKNGLAPIRNVLHHLDEVAREGPDALAAVYAERRGTLESSVSYLDTLARNYARLTPALSRESCDVNAVVHEVVGSLPAGGPEVRAETAPLPPVPADRLALRRILENLVGNAVDSVAPTGGRVAVSTAPAGEDGARAVRITVADTGPGMTRTQLDRAFDDFFTTKSGGTGLGLSIVRRLVLDLGGALRVDTAPGEGTRITVELPAAAGEDGRS